MLRSFSPLMRRTEVLIVALPHPALLLPQWVLPNDDRSNPFLSQKVDDALAGGVQIVVNPAVARSGDAFHLTGDALSLLFGKQLFELLHALIVPLVPRFERTT